MKKPIMLMALLCLTSFIYGQALTSSEKQIGRFVKLNSILSYQMLEPNEDLRKVDILVKAKQNNQIQSGQLYLGASLISIMDYQQSNTESKFGYLMRHPTSNNEVGKKVSEVAVHSAQLSLTYAVTDWLTAYTEILYDPQQSFGSGTITSLTRNQLQLRKGYIMLGNLKKLPLYAAFGKMDANFGQMGSVSPFTNSTMWHAFSGLSYGALVGFDKAGFNASLMLIQGGSQFRAVSTVVEGTNVPSQLNNFAADINYTFNLAKNTRFKIGGSYVKGTSYCHSFPVFHFFPCEKNNPASTFYANLEVANKLTVKGGYATTSNIWPGTFNPSPPLNEFAAAKVTSLDAGIKYRFKQRGIVQYALSAEFSNFVSGADGSPWERQNQTVLGFSGLINNTSRLFVEVFKTKGYAPLNFISGGNFENPGVTHSNADASSIGLVIGGVLVF